MDSSLTLVIITIGLALFFDFLNGFHDAANSIAAMVSTRLMKPHWAVLWAAFFNFVAFLFFGVHVATTIGVGLVDPNVINIHVILAALLGAIFWNIVTSVLWFAFQLIACTDWRLRERALPMQDLRR